MSERDYELGSTKLVLENGDILKVKYRYEYHTDEFKLISVQAFRRKPLYPFECPHCGGKIDPSAIREEILEGKPDQSSDQE